MTTQADSQIQRGDIFSVDFEPVRGSEQGKVRPALVIQNDIGNRYSPTIIVAALTTGNYSRFDVNVVIKAPEGGIMGVYSLSTREPLKRIGFEFPNQALNALGVRSSSTPYSYRDWQFTFSARQ